MAGTWERMHEITSIDKETAGLLFKCFDQKKEVESLEMLVGGRSTTNYKVIIKGLKQAFVLRVYPRADRSCHKEFAVHNAVKDYIPVPEIYYINDEKTVIDKPYAIVQFLDGVMLDRYMAENTGLDGILAEEIGEKLACLHQKEFDREGYLDENLNIVGDLPPILSWYGYFLNNRAGERLGSEMKMKVLECLRGNHDLLVQVTQRFTFSHGDFRPSNMMVKDGKLIGILDWEKSFSAPAYYDIGQFTRYMEQLKDDSENSFIKGYNRNARIPVSDEWRKIAKLTDLANILWLLDIKEDKPVLFSEMRNLVRRTMDLFNT